MLRLTSRFGRFVGEECPSSRHLMVESTGGLFADKFESAFSSAGRFSKEVGKVSGQQGGACNLWDPATILELRVLFHITFVPDGHPVFMFPIVRTTVHKIEYYVFFLFQREDRRTTIAWRVMVRKWRRPIVAEMLARICEELRVGADKLPCRVIGLRILECWPGNGDCHSLSCGPRPKAC